MVVEYRTSKVTTMDVDSNIGYQNLSSDGNKFLYLVFVLRNNPLRLTAAFLGLLCVVLLTVTIGQSVHYGKEKQTDQSNLKAINTEKETLQRSLAAAQMQNRDFKVTNSQLKSANDYQFKKSSLMQTNINSLTAEIKRVKDSQSQVEASNAVLSREKEQLKSNNDELQEANSALVSANDQLMKRYDGMLKSKNALQASLDSVTKDANNLQNKYNNVTRSKERLQDDYNTLIKDVEHLQDRYNFSTSEKETLESSHQNLTISKAALQESYNVLIRARDELQGNYQATLAEKHQLEESCRNTTLERDLLKVENSNLTAERDQLQRKLDTMVTANKCPTGWKVFQRSCYYTSVGKKTWSRSRDYCKNKGADLAIVKTKEEMAFLNSLFTSDKEVWIGLTDEGVEGQWKWIDGTPLTEAFWGKDQPNSYDGRNQDCVEFWHRSVGNGDWNDENCNVEQNWICEM